MTTCAFGISRVCAKATKALSPKSTDTTAFAPSEATIEVCRPFPQPPSKTVLPRKSSPVTGAIQSKNSGSSSLANHSIVSTLLRSVTPFVASSVPVLPAKESARHHGWKTRACTRHTQAYPPLSVLFLRGLLRKAPVRRRNSDRKQNSKLLVACQAKTKALLKMMRHK